MSVVIGPFGNSFSPPGSEDRCFLVGGGVGVAPLYFLARKLRALPEPPEITLCMGARIAGQLQGIDDFRALQIRCEVSTDDGSAGHRGFVTELLEKLLDGDPGRGGGPDPRLRIYGCGPPGMVNARPAAVWCVSVV